MSLLGLGALFLLIACLYATAGFGGGSSYLALLLFSNQPLLLIPIIALICNVCVVSTNCLHHLKAQNLNWRLILLPSVLSVPMAFVGGALNVPEQLFMVLLALSLSFAGVALIWRHKDLSDNAKLRPLSKRAALISGAVLGLISGMVGIGGGIFLSPLLYHLRAARAEQIAAAASFFILFNSIAGIAGHLTKTQDLSSLIAYWPLPLAVILGGIVGNRLLYRVLPARALALLTAALVLFVAGRLWLQIGLG